MSGVTRHGGNSSENCGFRDVWRRNPQEIFKDFSKNKGKRRAEGEKEGDKKRKVPRNIPHKERKREIYFKCWADGMESKTDIRHSPFFVPSLGWLRIIYKSTRPACGRFRLVSSSQARSSSSSGTMSSSFSDDRSTSSPLRRSGSFLSLSELSGSCSRLDPYVSVQGFIDNREKPFKHLNRSSSSKPTPKATKPDPTPMQYHPHSPKTPSPLSGLHQTSYEAYRPAFPRSKPQPDLYKLAITAHMRSSFQVNQEREIALEQQRRQQLDAGFRMGSPLAVSIMNATRDLEVLVASHQQQRDADGDIPMTECPSGSLLSISLPGEDWEMVDCYC